MVHDADNNQGIPNDKSLDLNLIVSRRWFTKLGGLIYEQGRVCGDIDVYVLYLFCAGGPSLLY